MKLSRKDTKLLWAQAGNRCSYRFGSESCAHPLTLNGQGEGVVIGIECHIIGKKASSARYASDCPNRESYENAILLCPIHHKLVDDKRQVYTVGVLRQMKTEHEAAIGAVDKSTDERVHVRNAEFVTEVSNADRAVGIEANRPASFSNVRSTLKASNVKEAVGFSTNQGLTASLRLCSNCGRPVPSVHTGPSPSTVKCQSCGHEVSIR